MDFKGKVALITGGGSGIGRAAALKFAKHGAKIAIADINKENADKVVAEISKIKGEALAVKVDIVDYSQVVDMANIIMNHFGKIDILVNNAAWDKIGPFMKMEPTLWYKLLDINLKGPIHVTRAVLEHMVKQDEGGAIVNVISDAAKVGSTGESVYSAAKGGVLSFTKTMAREMARYKIRVNSTCPGPTDTPLLGDVKKTMPNIVSSIEKAIPLKKIATPEQQANAIVWLASEEASYITGQSLSVNGGLNMC